MKKWHLLITILGVTFFNIVLTSCENFLKGAETKQQLERALAYANASTYTITVDYPEGTGVLKSPPGAVAEKKETDVFTLSFEPFTDYVFVCWKIIDAATGQEIKNGEYLTLQELDKAETQCTFTKKPDNSIKLKLLVEVAERPQIISYSPTTTNAIRDTSIQVLFDRDMDPYSIYFTQEELAELQSDSTVTLLEPVENTQNYYGYIKDGEIYYKNITITNKKTKANLLGNFAAPVLDEGLLTIYANKSNPPYDYSQILVNIGKDFFYSIELEGQEEPKSISMSGSKRWMYQVSNGFDDLPLEIKKNSGVEMLTAKLGNKNLVEPETELSFERHPDNYNYYISTTNLSEITDWNHKGTELYLNFTVQEKELGAGPEPKFKVKIVRESDETYRRVVNYSREITLEYLSVASQEAFYEGTLNLADYDIDLTMEGVYTISLICGDKSGNKLTRQFVFANDHTPPAANPIEIIILKTNKNDTDDTYTFGWKADWDAKCEFQKSENTVNSSSNIKTIKLDNNTYNIAKIKLEAAVYDSLRVKYTDYQGHVTISEPIRFSKNAINQSPKGVEGQNGQYKYGNFPQNEPTDSWITDKIYSICIYDIASTSVDEEYNYKEFALWHDDWVLGDNGCLLQPYNDTYYQIEPITWGRYHTDSSQEYLIAYNILDVGTYNYLDGSYCCSYGKDNKILTGYNRIGLLGLYKYTSTILYTHPAYERPQTNYAKREKVCSDWWTHTSNPNGSYNYCNGSTYTAKTTNSEIKKGFVPITTIPVTTP
jgi:hypothetical protein